MTVIGCLLFFVVVIVLAYVAFVGWSGRSE